MKFIFFTGDNAGIPTTLWDGNEDNCLITLTLNDLLSDFLIEKLWKLRTEYSLTWFDNCKFKLWDNENLAFDSFKALKYKIKYIILKNKCT